MKKILIIEHDQFTRDVYEEVLADAGFQVITALDGQDGLNKAQEGGYDLVLLDMMMPKMNGLKVVKGLNTTAPKQPNGQIILLTNLAHDPVIKEGLETGAKAYLIKSDLNPDELVKHVKEFLG